ncbi:glycoside hydrolase family 16 protein [Qipengyuania vesicularis]|uniref:glycoside hydrolase family 16 protein n=1 Tax=Qipengyuania vesicularis TaxID=2867232 RepID=UPI001C87F4F2|nr:glycoside hydrolase family 16 protein [Qipengyuania vesicularis]MBX7528623.1 glycoside hydrolase family 16 protein [Qipengyuania vesicularis]
MTRFSTLALSVACTLGFATAGLAQTADVGEALAEAMTPERELIFADEFDEASLDRSKWIVIGTDFWVNNEQQAYIDDPSTIAFKQGVEGADGGVLVLRPVFKPGEDPKKERNAPFVSGRIESQGKFDFMHGRAEARIKLPDNVGVWPAFWLLGNDRWPDTGEIDIMEYVGERDWIGVALHGPGYSGETPIVNKFFFPEGIDVTSWHTYAVEWTDTQIDFLIDGHLLYRATKPMVEYYGEWRFDNDKYLILNFAMGGAYPLKTNGIKKPYVGIPQETVDAVRRGEVEMLVDWVRVYAPE